MFTGAPGVHPGLPVFNHLGVPGDWPAECILSKRIPDRPNRQPEDEASQEEARNEEHR